VSKSRPPIKLRQRVVTALLVLVPLVAAVLYLPSVWLSAPLGVVVLLAAREWVKLAGVVARSPQIAYILGLGLLGTLGIWEISRHDSSGVLVAGVAVLWWVWALLDLLRNGSRPRALFGSVAGRIAMGTVVLLPAWLTVVFLHKADPRSPAIVLFLLAIVVIADSAAYFTGKRLGRTRLAPSVSPGKTVEGLAGALVAVIVVAYFCGTMIWQLSGQSLLLWLLVTVCAVSFSVVGDLVESKLKRIAGQKDSGSWLPGHGGVLDRIDALTAAAPAFALGWILLLRAEP
jgi:phosphatidate cytidylyltransferase